MRVSLTTVTVKFLGLAIDMYREVLLTWHNGQCSMVAAVACQFQPRAFHWQSAAVWRFQKRQLVIFNRTINDTQLASTERMVTAPKYSHFITSHDDIIFLRTSIEEIGLWMNTLDAWKHVRWTPIRQIYYSKMNSLPVYCHSMPPRIICSWKPLWRTPHAVFILWILCMEKKPRSSVLKHPESYKNDGTPPSVTLLVLHRMVLKSAWNESPYGGP